jgi:hypothetical protein
MANEKETKKTTEKSPVEIEPDPELICHVEAEDPKREQN